MTQDLMRNKMKKIIRSIDKNLSFDDAVKLLWSIMTVDEIITDETMEMFLGELGRDIHKREDIEYGEKIMKGYRRLYEEEKSFFQAYLLGFCDGRENYRVV